MAAFSQLRGELLRTSTGQSSLLLPITTLVGAVVSAGGEQARFAVLVGHLVPRKPPRKSWVRAAKSRHARRAAKVVQQANKATSCTRQVTKQPHFAGYSIQPQQELGGRSSKTVVSCFGALEACAGVQAGRAAFARPHWKRRAQPRLSTGSST